MSLLYFVTADGEPVETYSSAEVARVALRTLAQETDTAILYSWDGEALKRYTPGMGWYAADQDTTPVKVWAKCKPGLAALRAHLDLRRGVTLPRSLRPRRDGEHVTPAPHLHDPVPPGPLTRGPLKKVGES